MTTVCNFSDNNNENLEDSNQKLLKKLLKKLNPNENNDLRDSEYKLSGFLDNYYDNNRNILQNLMKYLNKTCNDQNNDLCSKILGKRSAPSSFDLAKSLKYLDDSIFNKKSKKLKKMKIKDEAFKKEEVPYSLFSSPTNFQDYNPYNNFFKKENSFDPSGSMKLEQNPAFSSYFNQNKMLTNFPNNPSPIYNNNQSGNFPLFPQNNNSNMNMGLFNDILSGYNPNYQLKENPLINSPSPFLS